MRSKSVHDVEIVLLVINCERWIEDFPAVELGRHWS